MGSRAVHNNYKDTVRSFKVPGMECSSNFASRLYVLRKIVSRYRYQTSENKKTLVVSIRNHPHLLTTAEVSLSGMYLRHKDYWMITLRLESI